MKPIEKCEKLSVFLHVENKRRFVYEDSVFFYNFVL